MDNPEKDQIERQQIVAMGAVQDMGIVDYQYANSTQTQASNWDLRMLFAERVSDSKVVSKVGIVMGHQHAKAFHRALGETIEKVERLMGAPIRFEPVEETQGKG